jgi:hypothetical protein
MSDSLPAQSGGPDPRRNPLVTALLMLIGFILLLPGLCSVFVSVIWIRSIVFEGFHPGPYDSAALLMLLTCFAIGAIGVGVIVHTLRRR